MDFSYGKYHLLDLKKCNGILIPVFFISLVMKFEVLNGNASP